MGRVNNTGYSKAFEGSVNDPNGNIIHDNRSIQKAVKGTISNESLATKNLDTLAGLANLDLFNPKRTSLPTSTDDFRAFPKPTINANVITKTAIKNNVTNKYSIAVQIDCSINNRVGFKSKLTVSISIRSVSGSSKTQTLYLPEKSTSFRQNSYTGPSDSIIELSWVEQTISGLEPKIDVTLNYESDDSTIGNGAIKEAYYEPSESFNFNITPEIDDNYTFEIQPISSLSCFAGNTGITQIYYSEDQQISNGSEIHQNDDLTNHIQSGNYKLNMADGVYVFYYNNQVQNFTVCQSGEQ